MTTDAQKAAMRRYYEKTKRQSRVYMLRFNREKDADIIDVLDNCGNKPELIRKLVRGESC